MILINFLGNSIACFIVGIAVLLGSLENKNVFDSFLKRGKRRIKYYFRIISNTIRIINCCAE